MVITCVCSATFSGVQTPREHTAAMHTASQHPSRLWDEAGVHPGCILCVYPVYQCTCAAPTHLVLVVPLVPEDARQHRHQLPRPPVGPLLQPQPVLARGGRGVQAGPRGAEVHPVEVQLAEDAGSTVGRRDLRQRSTRTSVS